MFSGLLTRAIHADVYLRQELTFTDPMRELTSYNDARWSQAFTGHSWGALFVWVVLMIVLQWASWPLVRRMFSRLPDRGWAFARPVSILLSGLLVWYPASLGLIQFRAAWSVASILILGAIVWLAVRRVPVLPGERMWRNNAVAVSAEWVFWLTFLFFLLLRAINPDSWHQFWGGEKPMEFAHLNAILRSSSFPPVDPWYAGGYLNYYYFGTFLVAHLIKATGIPVEIAFNLATPLFPAMLASGVFSLCATFGKRLTASTFGAILAGLCGTFFVSFAGNLVVATRLYERAINKVTSADPWGYWVWAPTRAIPDPRVQTNITEFPYFGALYADLHPHLMAMPFTVMVVALSWQIAASWRTIPLIFVRKRLNRTQLLEIASPLGMIGITIGAIWMTNAWDMPMFAIIAISGLIMMTIRVPSLLERLGIVAAGTVVIGVIAVLTALPFNLKFEALFGSIGTTTDVTPLLAVESHLGGQLIICTMGSLVLLGYVRGLQPQNRRLLATLGLLVPLGLLLQFATVGDDGILPRIATAIVTLSLVGVWTNVAWQSASEPNDFRIPVSWLQSLAIATLSASIILVLFEREALALYLGLGLSAAIIWLGLERQSARFVALLIAGAMLLGAALEVVYLVDDLDGSAWYRMNTIFKFYNQIWTLLGIACGVIVGITIWRLLIWEEPARLGFNRPVATRISKNWLKLAALVALPLMAMMGTYMLVATPIRLDQRFGDGGDITLNAYSWMEYGEVPMVNGPSLTYADDVHAIDWMNNNIDGSPVIAEAVYGTYRCNGSRFSIATGLPAVVGWVRHETQQRPFGDLATRETAMRDFYTGTDLAAKRQFLENYQVDYVIVGQTERHYPTIVNHNNCEDTGNPEAIQMIESMVGSELEVAYEHGSTTIYRVVRDSDD